MELRNLRYFATVAETQHFGKAAEQLHLAQPALSQSIRQLEAELGTPLLFRTTRQVSLTPAGEFFVEEVRAILTAIEDGVRGVQRIAEGRSGVVRIAFTGTAAFSHLPRIARVIKRELPDVGLDIDADLLTPVQAERLVAGRLDLGVLRPPVNNEDLRLRSISVEPLVLAVAEEHRLAVEPVIAMRDLRSEEFIQYAETHSAVNGAVQRSCQDAGFTPRVQHQAPGTSVLLALVAAGLGVALVPASVRSGPISGVVFRDVPDAATSELALAWHPDRETPLVRRVMDALEAGGIFEDSKELP